MKKILLTLLILSISIIAYSQNENPFKEFGYDVLVATSSKGEFKEFHDQTDIVEIGSVLFNIQTNEIVKVLEKDETTIDISSATAAMSIDPLCEKYYWISPYAYVANNPLRFVDPDGRKIYGTDGKPVKFSKNGGVSPNADATTKQYAGYMTMTSVGTGLLKKVLKMETEVGINIGGSDPKGTSLGRVTGNGTDDEKMTINIYMDEIKGEVSDLKKIGEAVKDGKMDASKLSAKEKALVDSQPTVQERAGQVSVHETEHATNPKAQARNVGTKEAERKATEAEMKAFDEMNKKKQ